MRLSLRFRRSLLSYALAILAVAGVWPCLAAEIAIVVGEEGGAHAEVAASLRSRLEPAQKVSVYRAADWPPAGSAEARFVVAVGSRAATRLAGEAGGAPLLVTLMPREAFTRMLADSRRQGTGRPMSALYLDQPVERQLDLVRLALPEAKRIGVLLGPDTKNRYDALASAAMSRNLLLNARQLQNEGDLAPALQALLPETDLLLALPDPAVFNAGTIPMILLSTYRHRQPLIGFSPAYTRAGALVSLYSTPAQIGEQAAEMLLAALARGQLPAPQHPRRFVVSTNPHVARSLGIPLESEAQLLQRLSAGEGR